jgi:CubicO group peptidase (beta-lactamase class C family)
VAPSARILASSPASEPANKAGLSSVRLQRIDPMMKAAVERRETPGMVGLIYRRGTIAHVTAAGWQNIASKVPMKRDTMFQIMSMTKPVTATAVLMLIDAERIDLYDPVEKHLPELANMRVLSAPDSALNQTVPAHRPMRILDLLTYRSGLESAPALVPVLTTPLGNAVGKVYAAHANDPASWLEAMAALPLCYQPGSTWTYGMASDVLSILVSRVSGMPFADFLQQRIFSPLGMKDTAHFVPPSKRDRLATVYQRDPATGGFQPDRRWSGSFPDAPPAFPLGQYGLASMVDDYLQFARMLLNGGSKDGVRILSRRMSSLMTSNYLTAEQRVAISGPMSTLFKGQGWGLGLAVVVDPAQQDEQFGFASPGTFGWPGAFGTWWQADPKEEMIQIYMHQVSGGDAWGRPRTMFHRMGYEAIDD